MRRAALSPNALRLPPPHGVWPPVSLEIVRGRQRVVRRGIFFTMIGKHRRSCYQQLNGETILADECKCAVDWPEEGGDFGLGFKIQRCAGCPIDEHQRLALEEVQSQEDAGWRELRAKS